MAPVTLLVAHSLLPGNLFNTQPWQPPSAGRSWLGGAACSPASPDLWLEEGSTGTGMRGRNTRPGAVLGTGQPAVRPPLGALASGACGNGGGGVRFWVRIA